MNEPKNCVEIILTQDNTVTKHFVVLLPGEAVPREEFDSMLDHFVSQVKARV